MKRESQTYIEGEKALINRLIILFICFFVAIMVAGGCALWLASYFEPDSRSSVLAQSVAQNVVGFIGAAVAAAWIISRKPARFLGLSSKVKWQPFAGVIIVYAIGIPFLNNLVYFNEQMTLPDAFSGIEAKMRAMEDAAAGVTEIILSSSSIGSLITGVLFIGILTGFSEELFFRGALQRSLRAYPPMRQWSIWLAAMIFSAVHLQFFGFFPRLLLGAFFGYLLYTTGSIWPGVFAHALNNSLVVVIEWIRRRSGIEMQGAEKWGVTPGEFPWLGLASLCGVILFFYFCYGYFFGNGKEERK